MGLLDHLWDDTVAGPLPDGGLGKLRKHNTFSFRPANSSKVDLDGTGAVRSHDDSSASRVTRSITIGKPPGYSSASPPVSPAVSTPPVSPFSESHSAFEEDQRRMRMQRKAKLDQKAPLLLRTTDI